MMKTLAFSLSISLFSPVGAEDFGDQLGQVHRAVLDTNNGAKASKASYSIAGQIAIDDSKSDQVRIKALKSIKDSAKYLPASAEAPVNLLYHTAISAKSLPVRLAAVDALKSFSGSRVEDALAELWLMNEAKRQPDEIRKAAADALIERGDTQTFAWAWDRRSDLPGDLRYEALVILTAIESATSIDIMLEALLQETELEKARLAGAIGLGKLSAEALTSPVPAAEAGYIFLKVGQPAGEHVVKGLDDGLTDPDETVRAAARHALDEIKAKLKV